MSKVIAIFGAGTGLGVSMARRFGREGYKVALVARRLDRLESLVQELGSEGIEAKAFSADLTSPTQASSIVEQIRNHFGRIDVVEYGPVPAGQAFTSATQVTAELLEGLLPLYFLSPVEVVQAALPSMIEQGDGAIFLTQGFSAVMPAPHFSGPGPVMAAARNYIHSLNGELQGTGVYAATIAVAAAVARSENAPVVVDAPSDDAFGGMEFPIADPDDIAELYWQMLQSRDQIEQVFPAPQFLAS